MGSGLLQGRYFIVTGGTQGLGRGIAEHLTAYAASKGTLTKNTAHQSYFIRRFV